MRTITLELLRHGPAHNQLLSPLTPYFALCGNHAGVTLTVPFEHNQFLHRLRALSYELSSASANFQLGDTAHVLGEILARIPGLIADTAQDGDCANGLHLRLIITASELALLPFELALSPPGHSNAGETLLLQAHSPICLTRETRRIPDVGTQWPSTPRILFIAAAPDGLDIPTEAHLLALRTAIAPWIRQAIPDGATDLQKIKRKTLHLTTLKDRLTFLPFVSLDAIQKACASEAYTHVHILAHGVAFTDGEGIRYGVKLHGSRPSDPADIVDGDRLATALKAAKHPPASGLARAPIVTLAACRGSAVGDVAGAGASIAHALNSRGFPLVVTSQFPLSFEGSVLMAEVLYEGLLWGTDPRIVVDDLRRRLFTSLPSKHDWASLTVYASFPADLNQQLSKIRIDRAYEALDLALDLADNAIRMKREPEQRRLLDAGLARIRSITARLQALSDTEQVDKTAARICGLIASAAKREAQIVSESTISPGGKTQALEVLERARDYYWKSFKLDHAQSWAVVQYLSLQVMLGVSPDRRFESFEHMGPMHLWDLAQALSLADLDDFDASPEKQAWALGNLIELTLLKSSLKPTDADLTELQKTAKHWCAELIRRSGKDGFQVYSTKRQIDHYTTWYCALQPQLLTPSGFELASVISDALA